MRHAMEGGCRLVYIAWSIQREPLDQTDLKNDGDVILKAVENRHSNGRLTRGPTGRVASRWDRLAPHVRDMGFASVIRLLESSRVFPC